VRAATVTDTDGNPVDTDEFFGPRPQAQPEGSDQGTDEFFDARPQAQPEGTDQGTDEAQPDDDTA
jgi:trigger factor